MERQGGVGVESGREKGGEGERERGERGEKDWGVSCRVREREGVRGVEG